MLVLSQQDVERLLTMPKCIELMDVTLGALSRGEATLPLDKWFGTFRDGLPSGAGSNLKEEQK